jgi:hypothetical protein
MADEKDVIGLQPAAYDGADMKSIDSDTQRLAGMYAEPAFVGARPPCTLRGVQSLPHRCVFNFYFYFHFKFFFFFLIRRQIR